ncbi:hypothetical protein ACRE_080730 [Hapsidospora chrysogenum ATCC 11550]|uniref:Uncharacterized protein n=1 Tax=Hapsidospora chrysogenum (strain ATCC 11550 / CBS 779.69 / DSM 880 / IAM 14645 / JCM 23072 / IMI 49137) TaxID=857340 RepID=A0A086SVT0_HAPC1|nr:hypothetical protein ACRE_080730 [Hapsidospora chrysogenum ATCC 11550]
MASAGNKSVISDDMQELNQGPEDMSKTIQGHKANLSNPNTSEQSKKNSAQVIDSLGGDANHYGGQDKPHGKNAADKLEGSRVT